MRLKIGIFAFQNRHFCFAKRPFSHRKGVVLPAHKIVNNRLYLDPALTRDMLLEELGIPKNKFSQLFRVYGKTSFSSFISDLRLQYACKLLRQYPNYTIEVIARECGMPTESNFYTRFSEKYGMTPAAYRKAAISLQNDKSEQ